MDDGEVLSRRKSQPEDHMTVHHVHQKLCVPGSMFSFGILRSHVVDMQPNRRQREVKRPTTPVSRPSGLHSAEQL